MKTALEAYKEIYSGNVNAAGFMQFARGYNAALTQVIASIDATQAKNGDDIMRIGLQKVGEPSNS
jgi:hypothetical protein